MPLQRVGYFEKREDPRQVCSRCRMCELICAFHHHRVGNPKRSRIRVVSLGKGRDVPLTCLNCGNPPCLKVCPTSALRRLQPGAMVEIVADRCIGCALCLQACPVGAISMDLSCGTAQKCDLCGGEPQCVRYCPAQVLRLTDAEQLAGFLRKRFAERTQLTDEPEART